MADCGKMQSASQYKESQGRGQSGELADRGLHAGWQFNVQNIKD